MEVTDSYQLHLLEKQFVAHKAAVSNRTRDEIDLARDVADRLNALEYNMSRLLLIVQTLGQICRSKDIFSEAESDALMRALDLSDGQADGVLNPNSVQGMQSAPQPASVLSFLQRAEKTVASPADPSTFPAQLEQQG
jgi:hypothetical protein